MEWKGREGRGEYWERIEERSLCMYVRQPVKRKEKIVHFPGYNIFLSRRSFSTDI